MFNFVDKIGPWRRFKLARAVKKLSKLINKKCSYDRKRLIAKSRADVYRHKWRSCTDSIRYGEWREYERVSTAYVRKIKKLDVRIQTLHDKIYELELY